MDEFYNLNSDKNNFNNFYMIICISFSNMINKLIENNFFSIIIINY